MGDFRLMLLYYSLEVKLSLEFRIGLLGGVLVLLMYPIFLACGYLVGTAQGCVDKPVVWFCGIQGSLLAPIVYLALAGFILKSIGVKHWIAVTLVPSVIMLLLYLAYSRYAGILTIPGYVIWVSFAILGGLLYAYTHRALDHTKR